METYILEPSPEPNTYESEPQPSPVEPSPEPNTSESEPQPSPVEPVPEPNVIESIPRQYVVEPESTKSGQTSHLIIVRTYE